MLSKGALSSGKLSLPFRAMLCVSCLVYVCQAQVQEGATIRQDSGEKSPPAAMEGVNPQRTRVFDSEPAVQPKTVLWKTSKLFELHDSYLVLDDFVGRGGAFPTRIMLFRHGFSEPIGAGGTIYFSLFNEDGYVFAQHSRTGSDQWRFHLKKLSISPPAVAGDTVYVGASDGTFYALNAATGQEFWKVGQKGFAFYTRAPAVANGVVYFSSIERPVQFNVRPEGRVFALDARTGRELWVFKTKGSVSAPSYAEGTIFVGDSEGQLRALDSKTGQERWKSRLGRNGADTQPAVKEETVYLITRDGILHAVDAQTGQERWKAKDSPKAISSLAIYGGMLYYAGAGHSMHAVDAFTGRPKWSYKTRTQCWAPVIAGGFLYFPSDGGIIFVLDATTGTEKWRIKTEGTAPSAPIIEGGTIYFLNQKGHMYAMK